jgi:osmotically-inducible protein OsmY
MMMRTVASEDRAMKYVLICCMPVLALAIGSRGAAEERMPSPTSASASAAATTDVELAADRIRQALRNDATAAKVSVTTHASTVVLTGTVTEEAAAQRVRSLAESAAAGARVTSQIEVDRKHQQATEQQSVRAREVEAALKSDSSTASLSVLVAIDERGRIVLLGPVPTAAAREAAGRVAAQVAGRGGIDNRLVVPD